MSRSKWSEKYIAQLEREGRGLGVGSAYKPWLRVQDVSSLGLSRRVWSPKTNRQHDLLSGIEYKLFLCLEWAEDVVDIREQYPLDREVTLHVAEALGIRHPHYPGTQIPTVMTIDFLVTRICDGKKVNVALNAKSADDAEDENSLIKLEIQRESCALQKIEHHLIFDTSIPEIKASNFGWVRDALPKEGEIEPYPGYFDGLCIRMEHDLAAGLPAVSLRTYCSDFDARFGTSQGVGIRIARMLLNKRKLHVDMDTTDIPGKKLSEFSLTSSKPQLRVVGAK